MNQQIAHIALVVNDYDEAIRFYCDKLHFNLVEDTVMSETKRWVMVKPSGPTSSSGSSVGNQTGGRVFLFLHTDNFQRDYQNLLDQGIRIVRQPSIETYGQVAVFEDLYGNLWDLVEPTK
jgi:catechol 2,3-dioxygenase-like lactoylglutathione lyase family enzyme